METKRNRDGRLRETEGELKSSVADNTTRL